VTGPASTASSPPQNRGGSRAPCAAGLAEVVGSSAGGAEDAVAHSSRKCARAGNLARREGDMMRLEARVRRFRQTLLT
jgi:hypothetical protein